MGFVCLLIQVSGETPVPLPSPTIAQWADPITGATIVIAFFTIVSVIVSTLMWTAARKQAQITQRMFEAAHRPYVGVVKLGGMMNHRGDYLDLFLNIILRNSGEVPANELIVTWKVSVKGQVLKQVDATAYPIVLLPDSEEYARTSYILPSELYDQHKHGEPLDITATVIYKGVTEKEYRYEQHATIRPNEGYVMTGAKST